MTRSSPGSARDAAYEKHAKRLFGTGPRSIDSITHFYSGWDAALRSHAVAATAREPVAWRAKNDYGHWHATVDRALADTWRDTEKFDVQPLYVDAAQGKIEPAVCSRCEGKRYITKPHPNGGWYTADCPDCTLPSTDQHSLPGHEETQDALNSLTIRSVPRPPRETPQ
jgi:hypothetical protein